MSEKDRKINSGRGRRGERDRVRKREKQALYASGWRACLSQLVCHGDGKGHSRGSREEAKPT